MNMYIDRAIRKYEEKHRARLYIRVLARDVFPDTKDPVIATHNLNNLRSGRVTSIKLSTLKALCSRLECTASELLNF